MRRSLSKRSRYEKFVAANAAGLVKLAYAICGDRGCAEDAAQEALTRVYQRWSRLDDPLAYARRTAATLNITTGTVKSQTARAVARMREVLTPPEPATHEMETT
jgi:DNA-directed RNA polymerase specialized sigma24 family protein